MIMETHDILSQRIYLVQVRYKPNTEYPFFFFFFKKRMDEIMFLAYSSTLERLEYCMTASVVIGRYSWYIRLPETHTKNHRHSPHPLEFAFTYSRPSHQWRDFFFSFQSIFLGLLAIRNYQMCTNSCFPSLKLKILHLHYVPDGDLTSSVF